MKSEPQVATHSSQVNVGLDEQHWEHRWGLRNACSVGKLMQHKTAGEPMGRGIRWVLGRFPAGAVLDGCCMEGFPAKAVLAWGCVEEALRDKLLAKALAKAFAILLACGSLKSTELGLGAACDTATRRWRERQESAQTNRLARTRSLRCQTCSNRVIGLSTCAGAEAR